MIWLILALLSFIGGQIYLFHLLGELDRFLAKRPDAKGFTYDDNFRYWDDISDKEETEDAL